MTRPLLSTRFLLPATVAALLAGAPAWAAAQQLRMPRERTARAPVLNLDGPSILSEPGAAPEVVSKEQSLIADVRETELELEITPGRSKLFRTKLRVSRVSIIDPAIVEIVEFGPTEFELIGLSEGTTVLTLWFDEGPEDNILRYLVTVRRPPEESTERELQYGDLQDMINELFPNSMVYLVPVADKLIVKGQARDSEEATQIMAVIRGETVNAYGQFVSGLGPVQGAAADVYPDEGQSIEASSVISMLEVPGEQQVMLKVRIAELSRTSLRDMGVEFDTLIGDSSFFTSILSGAPTVVATFDDGDVTMLLKAFASNGMSKILAEPNLVTLNGYTASFIAGGEFAVPTVVGVGGAAASTTSFRGFGTQLTFTPTIVDKDRIRLQVSPEFSSLDSGNSVGGIPGLNTRAANTTVELREGQWLAIAGLLQDEQTGSNSRIPFVGDIPYLRALFSDKTVTTGETELIVLVSPELVHPMEPEELPPLLPGMEVTQPDDHHFYIHGHIEGQPGCDHRATVWPMYADEIQATMHREKYQSSESFYLSGPHGFSE